MICISARPQRANGSASREAKRSAAASHSHVHWLRQYFRLRGSRMSCGAPVGAAMTQRGHPPDVAGAERPQPRSAPTAPQELDRVTEPAAGLHAAQIVGQRLGSQAQRRRFELAHTIPEGRRASRGDSRDCMRLPEGGTEKLAASLREMVSAAWRVEKERGRCGRGVCCPRLRLAVGLYVFDGS